MPETLLRTKASPKWLGKQVIFIMAICGFAAWAFYDASIAYPKRGEQAADFLKLQYVKAVLAPGVLERATVDDPEAELAKLHEREAGTLSPIQKGRMEWLEALRNAGKLDKQHAQIPDAAATRDALEKRFTKADQAPKALSRFDIPVQWGIAIGCGAIGAAMIAVLFRTVGTAYTFDPATQTLTLPGGGASITPGDVELFDKRKWDKFLVFLKIKPGSHPLAGREVRLDLLRHVPLEDWILEMEKTAFPPAPEPQVPASPSAMLMTQPDLDMPKT